MEMSLENAGIDNNILAGSAVLRIPASLAEVLPRDINSVMRETIKHNKVVHLMLDRATRHGQDPETLEAQDIRQGGLSLSTMADLHRTFTGISPMDCFIQLNTGAENIALLALFSALFQANGIKICNLEGTVGANPLPVLLEDGTLPVEMEAIYGELTAGIRWAEKNAPKLRTVLVDSTFYAKIGMDKATEIGLTLAEAFTYQQALANHGIKADSFVKHLEIVLSGGSEEENSRNLRIFSELWLELQKECKSLPLLALMEGSDSQLAAGNMSEEVSEAEVKEAALKLCTEIMQGGGLDRAMLDGSLQKKIIAKRNYCLGKMAEVYEKGELTWPMTIEQRIDTAYIKDLRIAEIEEYQREIDEIEKSRYLARTVRLNMVEDCALIDVAKEAFFAGASLADVVIALHTNKNDCYLENVIDCRNVLQSFVKLRSMLEAGAWEYGRRPSLVICDIWQVGADGEAEAWQRIFNPAGLRTEVYRDEKLPEAVASDLVASGAYAVLMLLPQGRLAQSGILARELRYLNSDLQIFVAEAGATASGYVYPISWVRYLTTDSTTCLDLIREE